MSMNSINTNTGAMIALQSLNMTNASLDMAQNEVSTGLKVAGAKDDGAIWNIAQSQRSQISSLGAVTDSLNRASSVLDVAVSAGQTISDLLNQMKAKTLEASDTSLSTSDRAALNSDFQSLITQIKNAVSNASFDGANMIESGGTTLYALSGPSGTNKLTLAAQSLALGGANLTVAATASFTTATQASTLLTTINSSITNVNLAVSKLGTEANQVTESLTFVSNLSDSLTTGVGNLVDADVAAESATLQALQTKQQLGVQALSIANASSSNLLSLFRG
ncbi:flagellin [Caulobacter sp. S45]|uniref:flagellin n=1 Tax=Caulobacter sp. S45 TaxID=1641861 RepID=UPI0015750AFD|nr:flagellin [Caulobacter sp. S45]